MIAFSMKKKPAATKKPTLRESILDLELDGPCEFPNGKLPSSLKDEAIEAQREHAKRRVRAENFGTPLLHLFNVGLVEHVRQTGPSTYVAVFLPTQATHILVGTSWFKDKTGKEIPEHGYATSVVAKPLAPRVRQTSLKLTRCIPAGAPVYRIDGNLQGKRGVLRWLVVQCRAKIHLKAIGEMTVLACDELYIRLRRASLRRKLDL